MNNFDHEEEIETNNECFFAKILRECSMEQENPYLIDKIPSERLSESEKRSKDEKIPIDEFNRWKGLEESEGEDTFVPEPHLVRAQSLRLEQERKINIFVSVFGQNGIDPLTGKMKTFSPQKHKRIGKGKK